MRISAVIITLNEEANLARCIASLQGIADEVVVVDSYSQDNTRAIAESFPDVKFYSQKWLGYAEQKNHANSLSSYDTILSIDADEVLSKELQNSVKEIKKEAENKNRVFEVSRLTNYCGHWIRHCGWYPDRKIRIFDRRSVRWQGDFVHETLSLPQKVEIIRLKGDLLHYSYKNASDHVKQFDKFTTLTAMEANKKGKNVSLIGLMMRPKWKFIRDFVFKLGFLDGYAGYRVCKMSSFATFLKYAKLKELNENDNTDKQN